MTIVGGINFDDEKVSDFQYGLPRWEFLLKGEPIKQLALASHISEHGETVLSNASALI